MVSVRVLSAMAHGLITLIYFALDLQLILAHYFEEIQDE